MASVSSRVKEVKQPRGGYIKPSSLKVVVLDDGIALNPEENIHASIVGMAVDYLTRIALGEDKENVFTVALNGATVAEKAGIKGAVNASNKLLKSIKGMDNQSIVSVCKLSTFDVWYRNPMNAMMAKTYKEINPDTLTVQNIKTLVLRCLSFFKEYGPIVKTGFTFEPQKDDFDEYLLMRLTGNGVYGGYTGTINSGDGDYLTKDALWDFKVSTTKPKTQHTLQLLVYWIMGLHSGQECYKTISKLGIFNPRLNTVYTIDVSNIPNDIIKTVEKEVICYPD